jgi:hypothetical protein
MHLLKRNGSGAVSVGPQDSINIKLLGIEVSHLFITVLFVSRKTDRHVGKVNYSSVSQPPDAGPVPGPGINYTGP